MCSSCSWKIGTRETLKTPHTREAKNVASYKTSVILFCIYSASPQKFKNAYRPIMFNGASVADEIETEKDIENLATTHDSGDDIKFYKADFLKIAQDIMHTDAELKNATCQVGLTR